VKSIDSNLLFIVALTEHRQLGSVFVACLAELRHTCLEVSTVLREKAINNAEYGLTDAEKEIVRLAGKYSQSNLLARFSRSGSADELFAPSNSDFVRKHVIPFVEKQMVKIAQILMKSGIPLYRKDAKYARLYEEDLISVPNEYASIRFDFNRHGNGTDYRLRVYRKDREVRLTNRNVHVITNDPCIVEISNELYVFADIGSKKIVPFLTREVISISREMEEKYFRNFVAGIIADHQVVCKGFTVNDLFCKPVPVLCLEPDLRYLPVFILRFRYAGKEFLYSDTKQRFVVSDFSTDNYKFERVQRDAEAEKQMIQFIAGLGLEEDSGTFTLPNLKWLDYDQAVYHLVTWLSEHSAELTGQGFEIRQATLAKKYFTGVPEVKFEIRGKSDWFDVYGEVRFGEYRIPFIKLRKYILHDIREFELPDGTVVLLPEEWFTRYKILYPFAKGEGYVMSFQRHHFHLLKYEALQSGSEVYTDLFQDFENSSQISVPEGLKAELRNYQLTGFRWMYSLFRNNLGGCLADDMGLGKTIQAIAYLMKVRKLAQPSRPQIQTPSAQLSLFDSAEVYRASQVSLIVMPTSLVHNWESELARFAPAFKVYKHTGPQRMNQWRDGSPPDFCDIILTTYGTLRNDAELLMNTEFTSLILDESQHIKNPASKTYKAAMELKAKHRMVLTGTPVENSLSDLWSQMNFLNRGLLGSYSFFKQNFLTPIETNQQEDVRDKLQLLIRPFMLRRTKEEVASDLPPLMEQVIYCPMTPEQESEYEKEKSLIRNSILLSIENSAVRKSSIVILQGLMRLRQLANHPRLLDPASPDESGKFTEVFDLLRNIIAENHKVLVFSSFVTHLELFREQIEKENWKYSYLTGRHTNRKEIINRFQEEPDNHIFLISLKAGGVGLNLTSAGYVFILDPWWNPAVENQAINRAHRIGQDKHVFVYRFITENTVEEKIERLKERKSILAETLINRNDPFKALTEEEILSLF
jgi:superfamily II DNA or RNA helicase